MDEMLMPGGWMMSMAWMRMPGQSWPGAAASFLGMWVAMMAVMMLPSMAPTLWRCRKMLAGASETHPGWLTASVGLGYLLVWTLFGMAIFPLGTGLAAMEMQHPALSRAVPLATAMLVVIAGLVQFTAWKARHLACCREPPDRGCVPQASAVNACRYGLRLGLRCAGCCVNLMAMLLVVGIMDLRAMAVATAAITAERLAPAGERAARIIGGVAITAGVVLIARAA